jgi:hypothetical protein
VQACSEVEQKKIDGWLEDVVSDDISDQPRLISEAVAGSKIFASKKIFFNEIINSEHQLNRLIALIYRSLCEIEALEIIKEHLAAVEDFHLIIEDSLGHLADCFEKIEQPKTMVNLDEAIDEIAQLVEKLPKNNTAYKMITEYSFVFFMEQILRELDKMKRLISKVNDKDEVGVV